MASWQQMLLAIKPTAAATWNPADKAANIVLSNSNLTASGTDSVRIIASVSSGKYFAKIHIDASDITTGNHSPGIGIVNGTYALTGSFLGDANGVSIYPNYAGNYINGGNFVAYSYPDYTTGSDVLMALDATNNSSARIWVSMDGGSTWQGTGTNDSPAANTGGLTVAFTGPFFLAVQLVRASPASQVTADFTTLAGAPTGFGLWPGA